MIQKKFSGGAKASAVDLDVATIMVNQSEQMGDLIDLCYKFRHTDLAADLSPSTEYTIYRILLESGDMETFLRVINDPINYGLFMNEHMCCLYLNSFLSSRNIHYAARVAVHAMHQEMFDYPLLNYLAVRALLEWAELAPEERAFGEQVYPRKAATLEDETEFNEENVKIFRFPFLKNPFFDGHFDLAETNPLVGKSLQWFSWHLKLAERGEVLPKAVGALGLVLQQRWEEAATAIGQLEELADESTFHAVIQTADSILASETKEEESATSEAKEEEGNEEANKAAQKGKEALQDLVRQKIADGTTEVAPAAKLSEQLAAAFAPLVGEEALALAEAQKANFREWAARRRKLIECQAQRAELSARLVEIGDRRKELAAEREMLYFFENRHQWEDEAHERDQLVEELGLMKKRGELTEEEYVQGLFHLAQQLKEGKTAQQALEVISQANSSAAFTKTRTQL